MSARRPVLFVTRELPTLSQRRLESLKNVEVRQHKSTEVITRKALLEGVKDADGLVCLLSEKIDNEFLSHASNKLKVISTISVGYDHVNLEALRNHGGIKLGYTPDVLTDATADTTVLLALMASRLAKSALNSVPSGEWSGFSLSEGLGVQFTNKTLGIVGLGRIGCATARRLLPFGFSKVLYTASRPHEDRARPINAEFASLDQVLSESDLICICCPLNASTTNLFNKEAFDKMKSSAILVNTSRGAVVNQDDLLVALDNNQIAHAALDVTVPEPIPKDHPLVTHPRCTILPHIGSATEETRNSMANLAIDNAIAGIFGEPLKTEVNL